MKVFASILLGIMVVGGLVLGLGVMAGETRDAADKRCQSAFGADWSATAGKGASAPDCVNSNGEGKYLR